MNFPFYAICMHWRVNDATQCMLQPLHPSTSITTLTRLYLNQGNTELFICVSYFSDVWWAEKRLESVFIGQHTFLVLKSSSGWTKQKYKTNNNMCAFHFLQSLNNTVCMCVFV